MEHTYCRKAKKIKGSTRLEMINGNLVKIPTDPNERRSDSPTSVRKESK